MLRNQVHLIGVLMLLVGCSLLPAKTDPLVEVESAVTAELSNSKPSEAGRELPLPFIGAPPAPQETESEPEEEIIRTSGSRPFRQFFDVPALLEEMIIKSEVIARVRLRSVEAAAAKDPWERDEKYTGSLILTLDVLEYLKGTGGTQITAYAYGWKEDERWENAFVAPTEAEAVALGRQLLGRRDRRWDDREAVVLLRRNELHNHYYLGMVGPHTTWHQFTVASEMWKSWLPDAALGSSEVRSPVENPTQQRFLLDDPGTETTTTRSAGTTTNNTITLTELRGQIAALGSEYNGGDGTAEYKACIIAKYEWESRNRQRLVEQGSGDRYNYAPHLHELGSGSPGGTWVYELPDARGNLIEYGATQPDIWGQVYTEGRDRNLLVGDWPGVIKTARPLPAGEYKVYLLIRSRELVPCDAYPEAEKTKLDHRVTVSAPSHVSAESFFDPYADGATVTGTTTVGTISWQAGRVTADLDIDVTGQALDFIGLDGTTTLSLVVADATETGGTLTWTVPTQPWSAGDKLMLRVRRSGAPTPTPTPTATPTPTPTPAPTPIPTDRPVVLFLDSLDPSVLDSLEMAVGEVFWVSVKALNLESSDSYTIEVSRVNEEPAGGVGMAFHYQACYYAAQSIPVSPGNTSYARTMPVKLCTGTGGTVSAVLKQGDTTLATADLEVSTPP